MRGINFGRVIGGGLLTGLIINISEFILNGFVMGQQVEAAMRALNRPPIDNQMVVWFLLLGFALGIVTVGVYAAIRPRFGPGVGTAVCAGLTVWFLAYAYPNAFIVVMHLFPRKMMLVGTVWGLFEIVIAGIAGAWLYTEA